MGDSREYPSRPICGVGVVVRKNDSVLLIRRGNPPRRGGWGLPGGAVELGETWREAARREVREECGVEIALGDLIEAVDVIERDDVGRVQYHYALVDFAAWYIGGDVMPGSDVLDACWVPIAELETFAIPEKAREVVQKAIRRPTDRH